ncbi:MAG: PIN domain-containing protein [Chloroflexota bacterium]|nr:PIN domain-containing protein [Chloroflexota bacterium]
MLIPAAPRDTLLRAAERGLYQLRWSDAILDEVNRNLIEKRMTTANDAHDLIAVMRSFFPEALVSGFEGLIRTMTNDPKDRHVLAAAVHAQAGIIVTENGRDFREDALLPYGIEAHSIDMFLMHLIDRASGTMTQIIREQAADLDYPPMTTDELLNDIALWAPEFSRLAASLMSE